MPHKPPLFLPFRPDWRAASAHPTRYQTKGK